MSTPTCRTCDTKFPGKETCKTCGADPNAEPTLDWKIEQAKAKPVKLGRGELVLNERQQQELIKITASTAAATDAFRELTKVVRRHRLGIAKLFQIPTQLVFDHETLVKERNMRRARIRSLQNTKQGRRRYKHGRVGVR